VPLSRDHRPTECPDEVERIRAAGGFVAFGRVSGNLAITRAMGDLDLRPSSSPGVIISQPEIREHQLRGAAQREPTPTAAQQHDGKAQESPAAALHAAAKHGAVPFKAGPAAATAGAYIIPSRRSTSSAPTGAPALNGTGPDFATNASAPWSTLLVIGSDGLFDFMKNEDIVASAGSQIDRGVDLQK